MPITPGLAANIRQLPQDELDAMPAVEMIPDVDRPEANDNGEIIRVEHDDGSVTISIDGSPLADAAERGPAGWFDNLVDDIDSMHLSGIANDLMMGIEEDLQSRQDWVEDRAQGIKLLGLKIEIPGLGGTPDGAPVEGMSRVRHPLLLEAVLRFQANARSELLPTDGPVKIRNDNNNGNIQDDQLSNALENDLNHYLTTTASEYYPDTDRMLFMLGFGGTAFKKIYFCPIRNRPVSETVDADDLIVNNAATDLENARRVTHRVMMKPSTVRRLQILGVYRDIDLAMPKETSPDAVQRAKNEQQGLSDSTFRPEDRDREIYECYCELNIPGFEHKLKGKETGLEIPYRVTIDVSTREVLSVVRNYNKDDEELPAARKTFVKYTFVPGLGFYDIGLLHILGNTTNAITAAWREMLDAGMFANFPGFLIADSGLRQNTNIFRVPPGGGAPVKTGGLPINQAIMPLPYKEPGMAMMNLVANMVETGQRVGGTAEMAVGEGKSDAPVGTTLAIIDQATKVLNSVHKRMHASQALEFQLLADCFRDNPESFWQRNKRPAYPWDQQTFLNALDNCYLIPQADPNTASQTQRMMKIVGLKQLQQASPNMYDPIAIDTAALQAMGWNNPEQFMAPPSSMGKPTPEMMRQQAEVQINQFRAESDAKRADAQVMLAQARVAEIEAKSGLAGPQEPDPVKLAEMQLREREIAARREDAQLDAVNRLRDRESRERLAAVRLAENMAKNPSAVPLVQSMITPDMMGRLEGNEPPLTEQ
jgi:hypothetical protein